MGVYVSNRPSSPAPAVGGAREAVTERTVPRVALPDVLPLGVRALPKADGAENPRVLVEERAGRQPHPVPCIDAVVGV